MLRFGLAVLSAGAVLVMYALGSNAGAAPAAQAGRVQLCASQDGAPRDPGNPLGTPGLTGSNPLAGAHLFVQGPWLFGGDAADAIADEVGLGRLSHQESGRPTTWAQLLQRVGSMRLRRWVAVRVHELEKIGAYPQAQHFSWATAGGSGDAVYTKVQDYVCRMQQSDPTAAAVITTHFIRHCAGDPSRFKAEVDALKEAIGSFPALIFVEENALTAMCWSNTAAVRARTAMLRYEIDELSTLPHALLYVEGGTTDADTPSQVARVLNASDASKTRGFFLNDTHFNWAYREIEFGDRVARLTGGLHFVVDTRAAGQGPLLNPDPVRQGVEQLCNPPGRGLGPKPGASNGARYGMYSSHLDGFVWVTTPGDSGGSTCPGRPGHWAPAGIFDERLALEYAHRANDRIGPTPPYSSRPW